MPKPALTDARIGALGPRNTGYDIRDGKLRGFGVRVLPSGRKRFFVHCQHRGERIWKIVEDAAIMDVGEARSLASEMLAAIRRGGNTPRRPDETVFEAAEEELFHSYRRNWKPGTRNVNRMPRSSGAGTRPAGPTRPCSKRRRRNCSTAANGTGSPAPARSTGFITATRSCPGSAACRSRRSRGATCSGGSLPFTRRRRPRTVRRRFLSVLMKQAELLGYRKRLSAPISRSGLTTAEIIGGAA